MAPRVTRLSKQPSRRVNYAPAGRSKAPKGDPQNSVAIPDGSPQNPIPILDSPIRDLHRARTARLTVAVRPSVKDGRVTKKAPKKVAASVKKECSICATTKDLSRSFKEPVGLKTCKHFREICKACLGKLIKTKISEHKLGEAVLACPFPNCRHVLAFETVKQMVPKNTFLDWDAALAMHHLRSSEEFIACLRPECGKYFSVVDCKGKRNGARQMIECPYCSYEHCLKCNRPWHGRSSCDKNKNTENKQSEAEIKKMGAKPCPKCGINIQKNGGCDHMTCDRCRYHFCWECLVQYRADIPHAAGCKHGVQGIANDLRNFVDDHNFNPGRVQQLMNAAQAAPAIPHNAVNPPNPPQNPGLMPAVQHLQNQVEGIHNTVEEARNTVERIRNRFVDFFNQPRH